MMATIAVVCRRATENDVEALYLLIQGYAEKGIMLYRSRETLRAIIDTFVIAEADGRLIGCGSLSKLGKDLVEVRSLGMTEGFKGQGIGSLIVNRLVEEARNQGIPTVMALTYEVKFFERNGFEVVPKEIFPEKVWRDCIHCKKQHCCDEIAVQRRL
ncbi:MAG: acetyltransferase [Paenibacillaceae bacterium]|jgi:amino-acid N-acetyltransferase|nr:acetyltransferase [Paenibacillaceae bacterium]